MNIEQKYVELSDELYDAIKGMYRTLAELKKPGITSDNYRETMGRIDRFVTKCALIPAEIKKMNLPKEKMLELFSKTKYSKEKS
jgi:hypothetical protein